MVAKAKARSDEMKRTWKGNEALEFIFFFWLELFGNMVSEYIDKSDGGKHKSVF